MPSTDYDFLADLSSDDKALLQAKAKAKARQEAAWSGVNTSHSEKEADEAREAAAKQMAAAIRAGEEANRLSSSEPATKNSVPTDAPQKTVSIWTIDGSMDTMLAPTWKDLKEELKGSEGTWKVLHFDLDLTFDNMVGFFRPNRKYKFPMESLKESFEVIVKSGIVFRSETE